MRKILIVLTIISLTLFFSSCSSINEFEFSKEMILENIRTEETKTPKNRIQVSDLSDYILVDQSYLKYGLVIIRDVYGQTGIWSLFNRSLIAPLAFDMTYEIINADKNAYIITTAANNEVTVYDAFGKQVLQPGPYDNVNIRIVKKSEEDKLNYYEIVEYSYYDEGKQVTAQKTFLLNLETKSRTETTDLKKGITSFNKYPLKVYGLDGYYYYYISSNSILLVCDHKDKVVNKIPLVNHYNYYSWILDGKLFVQERHPVDNLSENYTYIDSRYNYKFHLNTYTIDLITGKKKELNVDYLIQFISPIKDSKGIVKYGNATIQPIVSKQLSTETKIVLINVEGEILTDLCFGFHNIKKVDDNTFYDMESKYIFNERLEPQYTFKGIPTFVEAERVFILKDDKTGIITANGEVLIPFEYNSIMDAFLDGKTIATGVDNKNYILDIKNKSNTEIKDELHFISRGLFCTKNYNESIHMYEINFYDYNNNRLDGFEYSTNRDPIFTSISSLFGTYLYCVIDNYYVLVETTLK